MLDQISQIGSGLSAVLSSCGNSLAPRRGSSRGIDRKTAYHSGQATRTNWEWQPGHRSGEAAIEESWNLLTARIRDMVRNNPILSKAYHQMVTLVIGTGILTFSDAHLPDGSELEDFVTESDVWFERWAELEADAEGNYSWYDMQRMSFGDTMEVGNHFLVETLINDPKRTLPLAYTMLEWEQLARERDQPQGAVDYGGGKNKISNGIEYDSRGRKVAYHFYEFHPYDSHVESAKIMRVPARRVIHNYIPTRASAKCGISWFAPLVQNARDVDKFLGDELSSRSLGALITMVVKSDRFKGHTGLGLDAEDSETGVPLVKMGRPFVAEIGTQDDVELLQSSRSGQDASAFINLMWTKLSMGSKLSLNRLLGDPQKANFGSIKSSHNDDEAMVAPIKRHQASQIAKPVRRRHIEMGIATGLIRSATTTQFLANRHRYTQLEHVAGAHPDIQPKEEGEASIDRMRSGRTTYIYEVGRLGAHWKKNLRDMKRVNEMAKKLGVVLDWTKGNGGQLEESSSVAGEKNESEETSDAS